MSPRNDDELAAELAKRFIQRRDVKAVQHSNGSYTPDRTKFTMGDLRAHLKGTKTFGHYLVDQDGKCKLFAFDIDLTKEGEWRPDPDSEYVPIEPRNEWIGNGPAKEDLRLQLRCMAEGLAVRTHRLTELPVAVAYSGSKGLHVYCFTGTIDAADAKALAVEVLESFTCFELTKGHNFWRHSRGEYRCLEIEVFPKQAEIREGDGLGNLMRLPLGIHQKTGQRGYFLNLRSGLNSFIEDDDPLAALRRGSVSL